MAAPTVDATANVVGGSNGQGAFSYTVTLNDTGTTTIGTFWFCWIPGQDYMTADPTSISAPSGWSAQVTTTSYAGGTGYAIEWTANSSVSYIQPSSASSAFTFTSTETPTQLAAISPFDSQPQTTTSFVYVGPPLQGGSLNFTATVACFREGTGIRTPDGDVPIEVLAAGDRVVTVAGEARAVIWTGRRHVRCNLHPDPVTVWPVRISAGALDPNVPAADLWISPDHALCLDGVLVPVKHLINGITIVQVPVAEVTWHHLELAGHDVILAEGAPAETYLDTGGRALFESQTNVSCPGVAAPGWASFIREGECRLPLVVSGAPLASLRRRLGLRAMTFVSPAEAA